MFARKDIEPRTVVCFYEEDWVTKREMSWREERYRKTKVRGCTLSK